MNKMLALALALVAEAYKNDFDKGGKPMMLHFIHVMNEVEDEKDKIVAVLHDTVEDGKFTLLQLMEFGFDNEIVSAVGCLTKKPEEDYLGEYIPRVATNDRARRVKKADLRHNSDITRKKGLREEDFKKMAVYHASYTYLS